MYLRKNAEGEENPKPQVAQWKKKKHTTVFIDAGLLLKKASCHFTVQILIYIPPLQAILYFTLV